MGRGRTTTGMIVAFLIAAISHPSADVDDMDFEDDDEEEYDEDDRVESARYLNGEWDFTWPL